MAPLETWASTLSTSETSDGTFTALAEVFDINGVGITGEANDSSVLGQRWASFSGGKLTADPFTFTINWNPGEADHSTLLALAKSQAKKYWQVSFQGGHKYTQYGHVTGFKAGTIAVAGKLTAQVTITPSGEPTMTVGGS